MKTVMVELTVEELEALVDMTYDFTAGDDVSDLYAELRSAVLKLRALRDQS